MRTKLLLYNRNIYSPRLAPPPQILFVLLSDDAVCNAPVFFPFRFHLQWNERTEKMETSFFFSCSKIHALISFFPDLFIDSTALCWPSFASMLAVRAAVAAGANSTGLLASTIASLSGNATTLTASLDATTVMAISTTAVLLRSRKTCPPCSTKQSKRAAAPKLPSFTPQPRHHLRHHYHLHLCPLPQIK